MVGNTDISTRFHETSGLSVKTTRDREGIEELGVLVQRFPEFANRHAEATVELRRERLSVVLRRSRV